MAGVYEAMATESGVGAGVVGSNWHGVVCRALGGPTWPYM